MGWQNHKNQLLISAFCCPFKICSMGWCVPLIHDTNSMVHDFFDLSSEAIKSSAVTLYSIYSLSLERSSSRFSVGMSLPSMERPWVRFQVAPGRLYPQKTSCIFCPFCRSDCNRFSVQLFFASSSLSLLPFLLPPSCIACASVNSKCLLLHVSDVNAQ